VLPEQPGSLGQGQVTVERTRSPPDGLSCHVAILEHSLHNSIMERMIQKQVPVDGSWVSVDIYGNPDDAAIVVIPGAMSDASAWGEVARGLTAWPTVAVVNRRGREPSGPLTDGYSLATEVDDARAAMREFANPQALFGWSYGGLIALHVADTRTIPQVITYEPVIRPFAVHALPDLRLAHEARDWDATVEIATLRISGMDATLVESLRADHTVWAGLRRLSEPLHAETAAINGAPPPTRLATKAGRVDLIVGELDRGRPPYGTSFDDVSRTVPRAAVHELHGQGHLAHLNAPTALAALVNSLGTAPSS